MKLKVLDATVPGWAVAKKILSCRKWRIKRLVDREQCMQTCRLAKLSGSFCACRCRYSFQPVECNIFSTVEWL